MPVFAARQAGARLGVSAVALGLVSALAAVPAHATAEPDGDLAINMNYAINSAKGGDAMADVEAAVEDAGGRVLSQYPQVGVTIAQSSRGAFARDLREMDDLIDSVGATRTSAVDAPLAPKTGIDDLLRPAEVDPEPLEEDQWGNEVLEVLEAHDIEDGKKSVLVGVLDSGVNDQHEDLSANFNRAASVDCESKDGVPNTANGAWRPTASTHGTHVAGTIAAARNDKGIAGIAPGVQYASIKVGDDDGFIFPEYSICGFMWAAKKGVDITNSSYFIDPWMFWCKNDPDQGAVQESMRRVIAYTHKQGMVNVASAGNSNYDLANKTTDDSSPNDSQPVEREINNNCLDMPTELKGVITVSAIQQSGTKAGFSNYGKNVIDVAAPGVSILSSVWPGNDEYGYLSGTSMASPHVAGVLALIQSAHGDMSLAKMTKKLYKSSVDKGCGGASGCEGSASNNGFYGRGVVNALKAVR